jgi:hypothetical protein
VTIFFAGIATFYCKRQNPSPVYHSLSLGYASPEGEKLKPSPPETLTMPKSAPADKIGLTLMPFAKHPVGSFRKGAIQHAEKSPQSGKGPFLFPRPFGLTYYKSKLRDFLGVHHLSYFAF